MRLLKCTSCIRRPYILIEQRFLQPGLLNKCTSWFRNGLPTSSQKSSRPIVIHLILPGSRVRATNLISNSIRPSNKLTFTSQAGWETFYSLEWVKSYQLLSEDNLQPVVKHRHTSLIDTDIYSLHIHKYKLHTAETRSLLAALSVEIYLLMWVVGAHTSWRLNNCSILAWRTNVRTYILRWRECCVLRGP